MPAQAASKASWHLLAATLLVASLAGRVAAGDLSPAVARWHVRETASFRILNYGRQSVSRETADACERQREALARLWLGATPAAWSPKCHLVLHPSDAAYLREVGSGGSQTVASALVERRDGRIVLRRIDVRATQADWQSAALGHELAHVVLADRFAAAPLPRWLDEGIAILADPHRKRALHQRALEQAIARGAHFRVAELVVLDDYPAPDRWGAFYGQSASLVEYLVNQQGHAQFVEFVELLLDQGYEAAFQRIYRCGIAEIERRWQRHVTAPAATAATNAAPATAHSPPSPRAEVTTSAG